ncbi:MAG TPA: C4-type zinc ribbon domain-containing protein [Isosphaeraceae bacterium]
MPVTAENLRDLHDLHRRAKALRDRLASAPKTLAQRQAVLAGRQAALDEARKALQDSRVQVKTREVQLQGLQNKLDDLKVKLNQARKNEEYKAIQNQIAHDTNTLGKLEDENLEAMIRIDGQVAGVAALEAEFGKLTTDVAAQKAQVEAQAVEQGAKLRELEAAIAEAEAIIAEDQREQYRRNVKQRGADAFAAVEGGACTGCFVSVTAQTINELINCTTLIFCKSCGRILYLAEEELPVTARRSAR